MIATRRIIQASLKPLVAAMRATRFASENVKQAAAAASYKKPVEKDTPPTILDLGDTLKHVNYRYDFPQGLTEEQKKKMKRFDVFRYFCG